MEFTAQQVEQFREQGWLRVPEFWSEREIAAIRVIPGSFRVDYEHTRDPFSGHH